MADQKISAMTPAVNPLTGTELVPIVQLGNNVKTTANALSYVNRNYSVFSDSTTQTTVADLATVVTMNTTDLADGVTLVDGSKLTVPKTGVYNFQFSFQLTSSNSSIHDASIWVAKNGTNVPNTNTTISVPNRHGAINGAAVAAWNFVLSLAANDYIQFLWSVNDATISITAIAAQTNPVRPATPSVIVSVTQVY